MALSPEERAELEQLRAKYASAAPQPEPPEDSGGFMQGVGNVAAGALRGAGSIGATLLTPLDMAARAVGVENDYIGRDDRREAMDSGLGELGAQPESFGYGAGKLGGEIAGTLGVPVGLAGGATRMGASALANALRSGGLASPGLASPAANAALRLGGGAAVGGAAAGLVNPEEIAGGAAIGAALPGGQAALKNVGPITTRIAGMYSGAGDDALRRGYESGRSGGAASEAFAKNMRGETNILGVLEDFRFNLEQMRRNASDAYKANTANLRTLTTPMDMKPVFESVDDVAKQFMFEGQAKNPQAAQAVQKAKELVDNWAQLDPATYHTPEGIDALKQQIGALKEAIPMDQRSAKNAVGRVYRAVGDEIRKADPDYAAAMQKYSEAAETMDEITRALSLGEKASADTAMRKLQSLMRNNANTNYGARLQMAQQLEAQGGREVMPALAGQAVSSWTPRTLQATAATGLGGMLAMSGNIPGALGVGAISSPRLMGEAFYGAGRLAKNTNRFANTVNAAIGQRFPIGRINPEIIQALRNVPIVGAPVMSAE